MSYLCTSSETPTPEPRDRAGNGPLTSSNNRTIPLAMFNRSKRYRKVSRFCNPSTGFEKGVVCVTRIWFRVVNYDPALVHGMASCVTPSVTTSYLKHWISVSATRRKGYINLGRGWLPKWIQCKILRVLLIETKKGESDQFGSVTIQGGQKAESKDCCCQRKGCLPTTSTKTAFCTVTYKITTTVQNLSTKWGWRVLRSLFQVTGHGVCKWMSYTIWSRE